MMGGVKIHHFRIQGRRHRDPQLGKQLKQAPNAHPIAVVPPAIVGDLRGAGEMGLNGCAQLAKGEVLDVHHHVHSHPRLIR
jgi:hypothetical protein